MRIDHYVREVHKLDPEEVINWSPYANEMINEGLDVEFPAGTFVLGDSDGAVIPENQRLYIQYEGLRRSIVWGWNKSAGRRVTIRGAGIGKTILRVADRCLFSGMSPDKTSHRMLMSRGNSTLEWQKFDCPVTVQGISFDGNGVGTNLRFTRSAIWAIGSGCFVEGCEFFDFGPGSWQSQPGTWEHTPECFVVAIGLPETAKAGSQGPVVRGCRFHTPSRKSGSPAVYTTENTNLALGGNMVAGIACSGLVVEKCHMTGDFDRKTQQAPLHGITISSCVGSVIRDNLFENYQGACIYTDSGSQWGTLISNNEAMNVWKFVQYTCQNWVRQKSKAWQIPRFEDITIRNNRVSVSADVTTYAWDAPDGVGSFMGYYYDRDMDRDIFPGFINVVVKDNVVILPAGRTFIANYGGYKDGAWRPGSVVGDVPGITQSGNVLRVPEASTVATTKPAPEKPAPEKPITATAVTAASAAPSTSGFPIGLASLVGIVFSMMKRRKKK